MIPGTAVLQPLCAIILSEISLCCPSSTGERKAPLLSVFPSLSIHSAAAAPAADAVIASAAAAAERFNQEELCNGGRRPATLPSRPAQH